MTLRVLMTSHSHFLPDVIWVKIKVANTYIFIVTHFEWKNVAAFYVLGSKNSLTTVAQKGSKKTTIESYALKAC